MHLFWLILSIISSKFYINLIIFFPWDLYELIHIINISFHSITRWISEFYKIVRRV